ncbi:MAG: hypothetical protein GC190_10995 [Alphaproteobacteria bacterium]|nr:hypothetical protein [Alphaproteobacteria bacterium]
MLTRALSIALLFVIAPFALASEIDERVRPFDEGPTNASFLKFRNELKAIIAHKNAAALMKIVDTKIQNGFGGEDGIAKFRNGWKPEDPNSPVWRALSLVIEQGGNFDSKTQFSAPYTFSAFPSDADGFTTVVVTAEGAVMREKPKPDGAVVRALDHDILTLVGQGSGKLQHEATEADWLEVKDAKGRHGYVRQLDVRSPIDYRAYFENRRGKWLMTAFLAGD